LTPLTLGMINQGVWKLLAFIAIAGIYWVARNMSPVVWIPLIALAIWVAFKGNKAAKNRSELDP